MDLQKESVSEDVNGYIYFCPDRNFDDTTLPHMCLAAKNIEQKYFVMVTEIYKGWDNTWDIISNKKYEDVNHSDWSNESPFKVEIENQFNQIGLESLPMVKFRQKRVTKVISVATKLLCQCSLEILEDHYSITKES